MTYSIKINAHHPLPRVYLWLAGIGMILQFTLFKLLYPFPDFSADSRYYIYAAYAHLNVDIWPIGYSKFISLFHGISHSDIGLVFFQYLIFNGSAFYFFFSVNLFFQLNQIGRNILFIFLFFNPLTLYLSNYVSSDSLFAALSMLWAASLLWIIYRPKIYHLFLYAISLFACFTVRSNAYYYPIIGTLSILLSRQSVYRKLLGIALPILLILPFIFYTREKSYELTGIRQFSIFAGWQLANNALYTYDKINIDNADLPSAETKMLDNLSKSFFKKTPMNPSYGHYLNDYVGSYFIKQPESPLKQFESIKYGSVDQLSRIIDWGKSSPAFDDYGKYIIKHHPMAYVRYFMVPNANKYFLPPLEKLQVYNLGMANVSSIIQDWFDYVTPDIGSAFPKSQSIILSIFPPFFLALNLFFIGSFIWLMLTGQFSKLPSEYKKSLIFIGCFFTINFLFSVTMAPNVFRYQFFPMILYLSCVLSIVEALSKKIAHSLNENNFRTK